MKKLFSLFPLLLRWFRKPAGNPVYFAPHDAGRTGQGYTPGKRKTPGPPFETEAEAVAYVKQQTKELNQYLEQVRARERSRKQYAFYVATIEQTCANISRQISINRLRALFGADYLTDRDKYRNN